MSPVHVIVGEDARAEAMWATAFAGAVDLYRFPRNVDAFERLTAAEAPIDLVVLTPAQRGPFNLTPDQFIARVLEGTLGRSPHLANLHVIVVGQGISHAHPRVMAVSTMEAAIRLVKFGEVERAPRPDAPALPEVHATRDVPRSSIPEIEAIVGDAPFAGSVISRIWDAPRSEPVPAPERAPRRAEPQPIEHVESQRGEDALELRRDDVVGGGARVQAQPSAPGSYDPVEQPERRRREEAQPQGPQLFTRSAAPGFVVAPAAQPQVAVAAPAVTGGGAAVAAAPVGAPGESIEVATGALQPARPYHLPNGAEYRGPAIRGGGVHGAGHVAASQPVPPALAAQVQSLVYGGGTGVVDPVMTWSSSARGQIVTQAVPVPTPAAAMQAQQQSVAVPVPVQAQAPAPVQVRTVPMEPPAGVYGGAPGAPVPSPLAAADPFIARAEQDGGVAFG